MPYVEIAQREFETLLTEKGYKWKISPEAFSKEIVYLIECDGVHVKVFSSLVGGISRDVGSDAVRVVCWDPISNLPVMSSEARVNRTEGWRTHLVERIEGIKQKMKGMEICNVCGGMKVERDNRTTHEKFMGCLNYRNHPKKTDGSYGAKNEIKKEQNTELKNDKQPVIGDVFNNGQKAVGDKSSSPDGTIIAKSMKDDVKDNVKGSVKDIKLPDFLSRIKLYEVVGNEPLLETKLYQWGKYPFDKFNVIQSRVAQFVEGDNNVVVEAKTSTGKTIMGELFMGKVLKDGKKVIYTSPLKALTREKWDSWTKKFGDMGYKVAIITGDYRLTDKRIKELNESHIILATSEMLDHRTRNMASEKSEWLMKAGLLIIDEVQMIGMKDRGDKLEAGLMRFTAINPGCRLVLLSGTMPNSGEISAWISELNKKETILVKSGWRPIKLNMKYETYDDRHGYYAAKENLFAGVISEVKKHESDKILIFVHSKTDGRRIMGILDEMGYKVEFHNADLDADERVIIEESFKSRGEEGVRIIIATSTLAYGMNLPARIVIVVGIHRGIEEVSELDIVQMCGRSGRMGIDIEGDAIVVLPETLFDEWKKKIESPGDIISQMNNPLVMGFHIIGEIVNKWIKTRNDVYAWYSRTLASRQNILKVDSDYVNQMIDFLLKNKAIAEVNGRLVETELGKACCYFYLRPDMLKDLMDNWTKIFDMKIENNDFMLTRALSRLGMYNEVIVSKADRAYIESYHKASKAMDTVFGGSFERQAKIGMAYLNMIRGIKSVEMKDGKKVPNPLSSTQRSLQQDVQRVFQAMAYIDAKYARWNKGNYWTVMGIRLKYGVGPELVGLCQLNGVGGVLAKKMYDAGIRQPVELLTKKKEAIMALGVRYEGIINKNKDTFAIMGYKT